MIALLKHGISQIKYKESTLAIIKDTKGKTGVYNFLIFTGWDMLTAETKKKA